MKKGFELIEFRELNENVDFLELELGCSKD
ncbi:MAG: hypothetical protein ACI81T_004038 [Bacteroidia bacterium]|jgi:hypothetical protein